MKQNIKNLTNDEKLEIINNYKHFLKTLENPTETRGAIHLLFGIFSALTIMFAIMFNPLALNALLVSVLVCTLTETIFHFNKRYNIKKIVTNKMSYKQFKQLEKNGELNKWQKDWFNANVVAEEYQSKSYSLNSKEFAQRVVGVIQENNRNNSTNLEK